MHLIQRNEGLEKLLQFLITPTVHEIQANAVKAISKAAQSSTQAQTQALLLVKPIALSLNLRTNPTWFINCKVNDENCLGLI